MAFDDLKAELALLINQMENQPEDRHELYLQIRERLNEMRAYGMPLPEDLVKFEEELEAQFKAEEQAAKKS
jgi:Trm5-related predicted tRNA methylase